MQGLYITAPAVTVYMCNVGTCAEVAMLHVADMTKA